jgi:hypothetical protein
MRVILVCVIGACVIGACETAARVDPSRSKIEFFDFKVILKIVAALSFIMHRRASTAGHPTASGASRSASASGAANNTTPISSEETHENPTVMKYRECYFAGAQVMIVNSPGVIASPFRSAREADVIERRFTAAAENLLADELAVAGWYEAFPATGRVGGFETSMVSGRREPDSAATHFVVRFAMIEECTPDPQLLPGYIYMVVYDRLSGMRIITRKGRAVQSPGQ